MDILGGQIDALVYLSNKEDKQMINEVLTFAEAVEYLYIGRNTLLKLLHNGTIKGFKVGNRWRIKKEDLLEFMNTDRA